MNHDPLQDGISDLSLIQSMGTDKMIVDAARVSFGRDRVIKSELNEDLSEKDEKLIRFLLKNRHTSPFEHATATFHVACPIFVRSQWHRHRTQSYNEVSRRYTSDDIQFYLPKVWNKQSTDNMQGSSDVTIERGGYLKTLQDKAHKYYEDLLRAGVSKEQARMVLPQTLYTRFYATANLHNWMHFCKLRSDPHAQYEIRVYSDAIRQEMLKLFPVSWGTFEELSGLPSL